jgi:hypothetical protein
MGFANRMCLSVLAGLWTFIFTSVPIIHLIAGYFPVTFTAEVVFTMMAYYAIRTVMLLYCDSFKQMRALWFSRIAISINWCGTPPLSLFSLCLCACATILCESWAMCSAGGASGRLRCCTCWEGV